MSLFPQLLANSLIAASLYALVALGFNLAYGVTRFFNLAHGASILIGGYAALALVTDGRLPVWLSLPLAILIAGLSGLLLDLGIYRPLRHRKARPLVFLVASLGALTALQALIAILFTSQFQTVPGSLETARSYQVMGASLTGIQIATIAAAIGCAGGLAALFKWTLFGKAVKAMSDDVEVAAIIGLPVQRIISQVFFLASALAGLAGILLAYDTGLEPIIGMSLLLKGAVACIIGGVGTVYGGLLGALLLGAAENFGIWTISGEWKDAIAFGLLILFLLARPGGLVRRA